MKKCYRSPLLTLALCLGMSVAVPPIHAEDIDIFVGASSGTSDYPNVLLVLDNSSNWSANSQGWPTDAAPPVACGNDCNKQGYYELKAIRTVLSALPVNALTGDVEVNLGLMLFNNSNASRDGAYVRYAIQKMSAANKAAFVAKIDEIIGAFNTETASSSVQYSAALFDAFKYFGGYTDAANATKNLAPTTIPTYSGISVFGTAFWGSNNADGSKPAASAYSGTDYVPPVQTSCGKNYLIFIGNGFPGKDDTTPDMGQVLKYLSNPSSPPSSITEFQTATYSCSSSSAWSNASGYSCGSACTAPAGSSSKAYQCVKSDCSGNNKRLQQCTSITTTYATPSGNATARYGDEFANFLYKTDASSVSGQQSIITYTLDVYKNQPSTEQTALLSNMAKYGGGKYFAASDEDAIVNAFKLIFAEITSVNSTFASASLPVNATNRAQNENQVFIGMFRPDPEAKPRWFGNVKRYQIVIDGNDVALGDKNGTAAVSSLTGFILDCASSYWTSDSSNYWENYTVNPNPASGCTTAATSTHSDSPDGPRVEKGAVAEVLRKGNNPTATDTTPTWLVNRTIYGTNGVAQTGTPPLLSSLSTLSTAAPNLKDWVAGNDVGSDKPSYIKENLLGDKGTRASIHGDVVHSRPLPINYGSGNVVVYYGANDGMFRAVDATNGREKWAFLPYEFNSRLQRLQDNEPKINYPSISGVSPTPTAKDYFWDGSIGVVQNADNSKVWIYPTMRRGGRLTYALDVTTSDSPTIKWKAGCPNLTNDTDCIGSSDMGQTWSIPNAAPVKGYSATDLTVFVGGGYDACEDANTASPACSTAKGRSVFVFDADTGTLVKQLSTTRSVAADVAFADIDGDGSADYAYAADTGGNLYRISMVSRTVSGDSVSYTPLASSAWTITKVAYTTGAGGKGGARKFLFTPSLLATSPKTGKVYVALGSGDREHPLEAHYPFAGVTNRYYVFLDDLASTASVDLDGASMNNVTVDPGCDASKVTAAGSQKGWYMNLDQYGEGEQTVTSSVIVGGMIAFSTNRPIPAAAGSCSSALGEARGYWVNLLNGSGAIGVDGACGGARSGVFVGGGLPPSPVVGTVPVDGQPTTVIIGAADKDGLSKGALDPGKPKLPISPVRKRVYQYMKGDN